MQKLMMKIGGLEKGVFIVKKATKMTAEFVEETAQMTDYNG